MSSDAQLAGKERSFGRGVLLSIVSLGLYPLYWHFKAYKEVTEEFDVEEFPTGLYVASLIPIVNIVTQIMFMNRFIGDVNTVREGQGLAPELSIGEFLGWAILGSLIVVGPFVAYYKLQTTINEVWAAAGTGRSEGPTGTTGAEPEAQMAEA